MASADMAARGREWAVVFEYEDEHRDIYIRGWRLGASSPAKVRLEVTVPGQLVSDGLFRYELRRGPEAGEALVRGGFVGVYPDSAKENRYYGEVVIDLSEEELRDLVRARQLFLVVPEHPCRLDELMPADQQRIRDALNATANNHCLRVLEQVLAKLDHAGRAQNG